jgi:hypothetical protein
MMGDWTVFSNHGHVLVCLAKNNEARLRDVAADVGITERAVQKIVRELQQGEFVSISKHGRCNRYDVNTRKNLRHPLQASCTVGELLKALVHKKSRSTTKAEPKVTPGVAPAVASKVAAKVVPGVDVKAEPDPATAAAEKPGKKIDTRQQGSLF